MSAQQPDSVPTTLGPIGYGDALFLDADAVPGRTPVAVATQSWHPLARRLSDAPDAPDEPVVIGVKFMSRVQSGSMAGLCYVLDTPGTVRLSDIKAVHVVGDDGDRALVAFDKMGFRMVDGVHYVCKAEEERNAATAYPISQEEYDLEFVQHCRKQNRRKRKRSGDNDNDSDYDPTDGDDIYGKTGGGNDSSDSDYNDDDASSQDDDGSDSDDSSLDGFIVHSSSEEEDDDNNNQNKNASSCSFTHPRSDCDNPDVVAMRSAASDYRKWTPKTDQERAAKALIDRIEARARHAEDEKRFRRGKAALEADR